MFISSDSGSTMPSLSNPLQQAVFRGCVECIGVLVETPPYYSVDACCGPDGLRPIHIAAREGHISSLRYLTSAGACLLKSDVNGTTALHHASIGGQLRAVRWLLRHGAQITLDKRGRSPIQVAADHDHMEIVSLLAKHASSVTTCLTLSSSTTHSSKQSSPSTTTTIVARNHHHNNNNNNNNSHLKLIYGQSQVTNLHSQLQQQQEKDNTTSHNNNNNNNSHPGIVSVSNCIINSGNADNDDDNTKISPVCAVDSSSSGNSSLATTSGSNSPSLSPSATCSCSSSETSEKSVSSADDEQNYSCKQSTGGTSTQSVASFYLHPPKSSNSIKSSTGDLYKIPSNSQPPFYLHLPLESDFDEVDVVVVNDLDPIHKKESNSSNNIHHKSSVHFVESDVEIHALETTTMAPVTPVSATDFLPSCKDKEVNQQQKLVRTNSGIVDLDNSCSTSTSSSPSPPPPQAKTVRIQSPAPGTEKLQISNSIRNGGGGGGNNGSVQIHIKSSRPPPPPPPMPKFEATEPFNLKQMRDSTSNPRMTPQEQYEKPCYIYNGIGEENDYEDIDDIHDHNIVHKIHEQITNSGIHDLTKLSRTVSAPAGPTNKYESSADVEKVGESELSKVINVYPIPPKGIVPGIIHGLSGKVRVPFIPPNFPDPPKDALIKPSEYLRSIQKPQNKTKYGTVGVKYGCNTGNNNNTNRTPLRVEDSMKVLGNGESTSSSSTMPAVSEETNMEDEFEEINPERINGNHVENVSRTNSRMSNGHVDICGAIRSEHLKKVSLRKTPMTRTNSAPPLGRVLPDIPSDQNNSEQVRKTNEINSNNNTGSGPLIVNMNIQNVQMATMSRAAVIAELSESSQVGGVREWKDELRRRQSEQEKAAEKEMAQYYSPLNFVAEGFPGQIPSTDGTGVPIPPWKRQMLAKKAAEKARKDAEEQRKIDAEAKRTAAIPPWRRQLLQRRESDGKYAQ